jgi:2'-5' RNA ligase
MKLNLVFLLLIIAPQAIAYKHLGYKEYGIAVLPDSACIEKASLLNKELAKELNMFPNPINQWHITLYQGVYDYDDILQIIHHLKKLALPPLNLTFTNIYTTSDRWVDYGVEKTPQLQKLHESVVHFAAKYHRHPLSRIKDIYKTLDRERKKQVDKYGITGVLQDYKPHMSLFYKYPASPTLQQAANEISHHASSNFVCAAEQIAIGEIVYNGNMTRIVYTKNIDR